MKHVVHQKNGLYAIWNTVVDEFDQINLVHWELPLDLQNLVLIGTASESGVEEWSDCINTMRIEYNESQKWWLQYLYDEGLICSDELTRIIEEEENE